MYCMSTLYANRNGLQVIVGLGETGLSCVRYLKQQQYHQIAVTDSRADPPARAQLQAEFPEISLCLGRIDAALCLRAERLLVSPGIALQEPAIAQALQQGIAVLGDVELFAQQNKVPVIAITGSNGKSTVTTLVGEMGRAAGLRVGVGGNLGPPVLNFLAESYDLFVLELSSFQLETTVSLASKTATILNISEDHMDRYASLAEYLQAKQVIYRNCGLAIINRDDSQVWANLDLAHSLSFGLQLASAPHFGLTQKQGQTFLAHGQECLLAVTELKLKGRHQLANALAALALGYGAGLPRSAMLQALREFPGLPHRCQWVADIQGVHWYNDSKATNVGAALAALEGLGADIPGKLMVIAGGLGKNADFSPLRKVLSRYARGLILIGQDAPRMATSLAGSTPIQRATSLPQAIHLARQQAQAGDAVILAPACASYDMFKNFEHRGESFMAAVQELRNETA